MDLEPWKTAFGYLVSSSAALLGITFAVLTLKPRFWQRTALRHAAAVVCLVELAVPMFFSLIFLMPGHPWEVGGLAVGLAGYVAMFSQVALAVRHLIRRQPFDLHDSYNVYIGIPLIFVTFSIMAWCPSLTVKFATCLWLLLSGIFEAWVSVYAATRRPTPAAVSRQSRRPLAAHLGLSPPAKLRGKVAGRSANNNRQRPAR